MEGKLLRWIHRWREREDQRLVKQAGPVPDVDPIEELMRVVNDAQERDAEDERQLYFPMRRYAHTSYPRRRTGHR
jgi:hypothetical protein